MSETELQLHQEISTPIYSDSIEEILKLCPPDIVDDITEDYLEKIKSLSGDDQKKLLELWKIEDKKTLGVFIKLIKGIKVSSQDRVSTSQDRLTASVVNSGEEKEKVLYSEAIEISKSALNITKSIEKSVGNTYTGEIESRIAASYTDSKTQDYFKTLGIDINNPESRSNPEVQGILKARVSTQVYLEKSDEISRTHPELQASLRELGSLGFKLGIESTSKDITSLLPDVPRDTRNQVVQAVTTINSDYPDNPITRRGDILSFKDPNNDRFNYEINLANQPPKLTKTLKGISLSREIPAASTEFLAYQKDKSIFDDGVKKFLEQSKKEPFVAAMELDTKIFEEASKGGMKEIGLLESYKGSKSEMKKAFEASDIANSNRDTLGSLINNREGLRLKGVALFNLASYLKANGNESEAGFIEHALGPIKGAIEESDSKIARYTQISERGIQLSRNMKSKANEESTIDSNLKWLTDDLLIDQIGPHANEVLRRIIANRNQNRSEANKIDLSGKEVDILDKAAIKNDFQKIIEGLGFHLEDLRTEKIGSIVKAINQAVIIQSSGIGSIESLIHGVK